MSFICSIPVPPSANNLFANGKHGRYRTKQYLAWINEAGFLVKAQKPAPVRGKYKFFLTVPKIRGDVDNRIKAASDLIVSLRLVDDDRHCIHTQAVIDDELIGHAIVAVEGIA